MDYLTGVAMVVACWPLLASFSKFFANFRQNWNKDAFMDKTERQPGQRAQASETGDSNLWNMISSFDFCH